MKLPSPRNHTDVALFIFSALRASGVTGLTLRASKVRWSVSRYIMIGKQSGVRVSNHMTSNLDPRIDLDLVGRDIPTLMQTATAWLEENYGIKVQTTG